MVQQAAQKHSQPPDSNEGTILKFFDLTSDGTQFPPYLAGLKKEMCVDKNAIVHSWHEVLRELKTATDEIVERGNETVMRVPFEDIQRGLSGDQLETLKRTGVIIIKGGVPKQEALAWLQSMRDYVAANAGKVRGAPPEKIVFYEIYNSKAQLLARTHPALVETQKYLLSLWNASDPETNVSTRTPVSYFDRFRIRTPGPSAFTLGPHMDGGGLERWEDPLFRRCWKTILQGGDAWRQYDAFDISPRVVANKNAPKHCSVVRPWQGWTALSNTGPGEGTLQVLPLLPLATAYIILRPFFRLRSDLSSGLSSSADIPLDADAWVLDLDNPEFPGSTPGMTQSITQQSHPHLRIDKTVVSIPRVEPGDQVYWHQDLIHAVEAEHNGKEDACVVYIPAVPLTERNAAYLRDQRETFLQGLPAPDYPRGKGESTFVGRAILDDVPSLEARRVIGFEPFKFDVVVSEAERRVAAAANRILGF